MTPTAAAKKAPLLLTVNDVAAQLGYSPRSIRRLVSEGDLECVRPLGQQRGMRFTAEHVQTFLDRLANR